MKDLQNLAGFIWQRTAAARILPLAIAAGMTVLATSMAGQSASAQEPPPSIRLTTVASQNYTDQPRQYDLMQTLLELAPGASVPSHRINGRAIITVLSGEVTKVEEDGESKVFKAGQTYPESSGDEFDADVNNGSVPARLLVTFLLAPGAEPLIFNPNAPPSSAPGPKFVAVARTTVGTIPAQFTLVAGVFEVPTGFKVAPHTHDGWSIVTELSGGHVANRVNGVAQTGATFSHGPNDAHDGEYNGGTTVTAMFASVGPTGAPPSRPLKTSATPAIRPPATGDGGLAEAH